MQENQSGRFDLVGRLRKSLPASSFEELRKLRERHREPVDLDAAEHFVPSGGTKQPAAGEQPASSEPATNAQPVPDSPVAVSLVADSPVAVSSVAASPASDLPVPDSPVSDSPVSDSPVPVPVTATKTQPVPAAAQAHGSSRVRHDWVKVSRCDAALYHAYVQKHHHAPTWQQREDAIKNTGMASPVADTLRKNLPKVPQPPAD